MKPKTTHMAFNARDIKALLHGLNCHTSDLIDAFNLANAARVQQQLRSEMAHVDDLSVRLTASLAKIEP